MHPKVIARLTMHTVYFMNVELQEGNTERVGQFKKKLMESIFDISTKTFVNLFTQRLNAK